MTYVQVSDDRILVYAHSRVREQCNAMTECYCDPVGSSPCTKLSDSSFHTRHIGENQSRSGRSTKEDQSVKPRQSTRSNCDTETTMNIGGTLNMPVFELNWHIPYESNYGVGTMVKPITDENLSQAWTSIRFWGTTESKYGGATPVEYNIAAKGGNWVLLRFAKRRSGASGFSISCHCFVYLVIQHVTT